MPSAKALSVWMGVAGCGCPSSAKVVRSTHASWALWKRAPTSDSGADAVRTLRMMTLVTWMAPLKGGGGGSGAGALVGPLRKNKPPAQELTLAVRRIAVDMHVVSFGLWWELNGWSVGASWRYSQARRDRRFGWRSPISPPDQSVVILFFDWTTSRRCSASSRHSPVMLFLGSRHQLFEAEPTHRRYFREEMELQHGTATWKAKHARSERTPESQSAFCLSRLWCQPLSTACFLVRFVCAVDKHYLWKRA